MNQGNTRWTPFASVCRTHKLFLAHTPLLSDRVRVRTYFFRNVRCVCVANVVDFLAHALGVCSVVCQAKMTPCTQTHCMHTPFVAPHTHCTGLNTSSHMPSVCNTRCLNTYPKGVYLLFIDRNDYSQSVSAVASDGRDPGLNPLYLYDFFVFVRNLILPDSY